MKKLKDGMVKDLNLNSNAPLNFCEASIHGKQHRTPFPSWTSTLASEVLEIIHTDVCGPMSIPSIGNSRYFVTFIDDKTRKTFVYFIKKKDEVFAKFKAFKALAENQTGKPIRTLRSDNGGEYTSHVFSQYLQEKGIHHQKTVAYTPEQNGVAERANRTIMEVARCMLYEQNMDRKFWAEAVSTAVYLKDRNPTKALSDMTPLEAWSGRKPTVAHLRSFGCKAYAHIPVQKRTKLDSKTIECTFVGYCNQSKAYRVYDPTKDYVIITRDVIFNESYNGRHLETQSTGEDPHDAQNSSSDGTPNNNNESPPDTQSTSNEQDLDDPQDLNDQEGGSASERDEDLSADNVDYQPTIPRKAGNSTDRIQNALQEISRATNRISNIQKERLELRRSSRESKQPERFDQNPKYARLAAAEPQTYDEAMCMDDANKWEQAMEDEIESITKNRTWSVVDLPSNRKAIGCRWIFKVKYDASGNVERHKA